MRRARSPARSTCSTPARRKCSIDAGLFQGLKELRERNWQESSDRRQRRSTPIVLTHAHLDHCGYLPRLVAQGFRGRVFCTAGTQDLCRIVLPDAGRIQEEDAANANRHGYSKHSAGAAALRRGGRLPRRLAAAAGRLRPPDAGRAGRRGRVHQRRASARIVVRARADRTAGRSSSAAISAGSSRPVLPDPTMMPEADYLLVESTYGNRVHEQDDDGAQLARIVNGDRGARRPRDHPGIRDWPGRGADLLAEAARRGEAHPGAARCSSTARWRSRRSPVTPSGLRELDPEMQPGGARRKAPHGPADITTSRRTAGAGTRVHERQLCAFCTERFRTIATAAESKQLTASKMPAIVISASGMATGGRVLHHLKAALPDARNTVLFAGYQAAGTRGRQLVDGAEDRQDPRRDDPRPRADRAARIDVGACRLERNPALARRIHAAAAARRSSSTAKPRRWRRSSASIEQTARLDDEDAGARRDACELVEPARWQALAWPVQRRSTIRLVGRFEPGAADACRSTDGHSMRSAGT